MNKSLYKVPLYVSEGDIVEVKLPTFDYEPKIFTISKVQKRYGRYNEGQTPAGNLIHAIDKNLETYAFDELWITKIISRGPSKMHIKYNIFADREYQINNMASLKNISRSKIQGSFMDLLMWALAKLPISIDRPIDFERAHDLYKRMCCVGATQFDYSNKVCRFIVVHKKVFLKWVKKNYTKIVITSKMHSAEITKYNTECEKEYDEQCEKEYAESWYKEDELI